jgi:hypothetical protein
MSETNEKLWSAGDADTFGREAMTAMNAPARATVVNRTHRVVRARAKTLAARRSRVRSLWIPVGIFSVLLVIICTAVWNGLDQYDVNANGILDASNQFFILFLWFFPVSMALLAVVLFRRARKRVDNEVAQ